MRRTVVTVALILLLSVLGGVMLAGPPWNATGSVHVMLRRIQNMSHLTVHRLAVQFVQQEGLDGRLGGLHCLIEVCGDVDMGVDLRKAELTDVDPANRTARLLLPPAEVVSARLDMRATRIYSLGRYGLWRIVPSDAGERRLIERALTQAEQAVRKAGSEPHQLQQAHQRAQELCRELATAAGWTLH
jgi:hypothetical protein